MLTACAAVIVVAACGYRADEASPRSEETPAGVVATPERPRLGLFTTLPIYWGEGEGIADTLAGSAQPGWVRAALEKRFAIEPLDVLTPADLAPLRTLLLAQPRALSPEENVALDAWVRGGGRLLLFADPMLTAPSRFGIGDRRRPQDVVLLSPILDHWGLTLTVSDEEAHEERHIDWRGARLPLNEAGQFAAAADGACRIEGDVVALCTLGKGRAVVLADATVLEDVDAPQERERALATLISAAFD